jgi:hypothetical protein
MLLEREGKASAYADARPYQPMQPLASYSLPLSRSTWADQTVFNCEPVLPLVKNRWAGGRDVGIAAKSQLTTTMVVANQEQLMLDSAEFHDQVEGPWSEHTSPSSEDIEIVRRTPPLSSSVMRPVVQRRRYPRSESETESDIPQALHSFKFSSLGFTNGLSSSEPSPSSVAFMTDSTGCASPWTGTASGADGNAMIWDQSDDADRLLVPKVESPDESIDLDQLIPTISPAPSVRAGQLKRPRGRPRKHPIPTAENAAKVSKGRSKTGCITCRRRKKKCDEAKPECQ